ncbi:MAG: phosphoribosylanthranilate isomerase [Gammaproteobacteria bacterium]|nr:phosphoribosylanthranilate isomerase [Gammaproteobacteria bacterium]
MSRTRIKICGITRESDALAAAFAGADAIGLVFYAPSPRGVTIEAAQRIVAKLPAFVSVVGLFVDAERAVVDRVCAALPLDLLQFHGAESEAYCRSFGRPYIKAIQVAAATDITAILDTYASARSVLLDTWREGMPGGTGTSFDWNAVPQNAGSRIVLAGGLNPENVGAAIAQTCAYGVDVSGGVESAPGHKSAEKIRAFIQAVQRADAEKVK